MAHDETTTEQDAFATQLGEVLTQLAEAHRTPDEPVMKFIGQTAEGKNTTYTRTPREHALAVVQGTAEGAQTVKFYRRIAANLHHVAGEDMVIADLRSRLHPDVSQAP